MNKHLFRIIFNKKCSQFVAVAENTNSQGKTSQQDDSPADKVITLEPTSFNLRTGVLPVLLAIMLPNAMATQIVVDGNAPANQRPTIMQGPNGTPLVNIQTPSAAGISRNTYTQFDISNKGVLLNNDRQSNPWLATGGARIILNEINSANPSNLHGAITINGQRAELIIANPAGLNINGATVNNASSILLTAGRAEFVGDQINTFRTGQGQIQIYGSGLNTGDGQYTTLLSRAINVQAAMTAQQLSVIAGNLGYAYESGELTPHSDPTGKPVVAIDVSQLGGMYAGKIQLLVTEDGAGVRNAGKLDAGNGTLIISADGKLENSGTLNAAYLSANSLKADIDSKGLLKGQQLLALSAGNNITLAGNQAADSDGNITLHAAKNIELAAGAVVGKQTGTGKAVAYAGQDIKLGNGAQMLSGQSVELQATGGIQTQTATIATIEGNLTLIAEHDITLVGSNVQGKNLHIETGKPFVETTAPITLQNTQLNASGQTTVIASGDLNLQHRNASITTGAANVYLAAGRHLTVDSGTQLHSGGKLALQAKENLTLSGLQDKSVSIQANDQLDLQGGKVELQGSQITNNKTDATTTIAASETLTIKGTTAITPTRLEGLGALYINSYGDVELDAVSAKGKDISIVAGRQLQLNSNIGNNEIASTTDLRLHANAGLTIRGSTVTSKSTLQAGANLAATSATSSLSISQANVNAADMLSLSNKTYQSIADSNLTGGAMMLKTAEGELQLQNSQLTTIATKNAVLASYSGNLSIETGGIFNTDTDSAINTSKILSIDTGQGNIILTKNHKLNAGTSLFLRARNGILQLVGDKNQDQINTVNLNINGNLDLIGNTTNLNGVTIKTSGTSNIIALDGAVTINGLSTNRNTYTPSRKINELNEITEKYSSELITLKGSDFDKYKSQLEYAKSGIAICSWSQEMACYDYGYTNDNFYGTNPEDYQTLYDEAIGKIGDRIKKVAELESAINSATSLSALINASGNGIESHPSTISSSNINITSSAGININGTDIKSNGIIKISSLGKKHNEKENTSTGAINIGGTIDSIQYGDQNSDNFGWASLTTKNKIYGIEGIQIYADGAGKNSRIQINATELKSKNGLIQLSAENDIRLDSSKDEIYRYNYRNYKTGPWYNRKTVNETRVNHQATPVTVQLEGKGIQLASGGNIDVYAATFNAPQGSISLIAANALGLWAVEAQNHSKVDTQVTKKFLGIKYDKDNSSSSYSQIADLPVKLVAERASTASGWDTRLQGTIFQTSLAGADIRAGVGPNARPDAQIILEGIKNTLTTSFTRESNSVVWQKQMGQGGTTQTMALPSFTGPALPNFSAPGGIVVQIPESNLKTQVQTLAAQPGMTYLKTLAERNDINWQPVKLAHDQWQYKQEGLTPAGAAILSIAIAIATGPGGTASMSGITSSLSGTYATMAAGAINSLASQAAISLVNNKGDIGKTLKAMGQSSTVKAMVSSALTAGVLDKISQMPGMDTLKNGTGFHQKLAFNLVNAGGSAVVNTAVYGDSLQDALKTALTSAFVTTVHGEAASQIKLLEDHQILHKLAHAAAGCAVAAAQSQACRDGAIGAAVGEIVAEMFKSQQPGTGASKEQLADYDKKVLSYSKLVAGAISAYAGGDAQAAISTAEIAVQNNYLSRPQLQALQAELNVCRQNNCTQDQLNAVVDKYAQLSAQNDAALAACTTTACVDQHRKILTEAAAYSTGAMRDVANSGSTSRRLGELLARENKAVTLQNKYGQVLKAEQAQKQLNQYVQANCQNLSTEACSSQLKNSQAEAQKLVGTLVDLTPIIGDIKAASEIHDFTDAMLVVAGVVPGIGDAIQKLGKEAKLLADAGKLTESQQLLKAGVKQIDSTWQAVQEQKRLAPLGSALARASNGQLGELAVADLLKNQGYKDVIAIQNRSGHGIDVLARNPEGKLVAFEVKTNTTGVPGSLSPAQALGADAFVRDRIKLAANAERAWQHMAGTDVQRTAKKLQQELQDIPRGELPGYKIDLSVPKPGQTGQTIMNVTPWTAIKDVTP